MSKRALEAYSDSLRRELMFLGIPVIKIQPGPFDTSMTAGIMKDYQSALLSTKYYLSVLLKLKVFLRSGLQQQCPADKLVSQVIQAMEDRKPKQVYRTGASKLLLLLEMLPDKLVDIVYMKLVNWA